MPTVADKEAMQPENSQSEKIPFWLDPKKRAIIYQIGTLCMVGLLAYYLVSNTLANLERQSVATGFGFLNKESSFEIGESLIPYSAASSYGRALVVGALNTLFVYRDYLNSNTRHFYRNRALINELVGIQTGGDLY